jgi:hypothetical protein
MCYVDLSAAAGAEIVGVIQFCAAFRTSYFHILAILMKK